jgi:predicted phage baseplate assembly protein
MTRGPLMLRSRGRAVTAEDFEELAKEAAPEAARIRCVPAGGDGPQAGAVRILVVPNVHSEAGRLPFERLVPPQPVLDRIAEALDRKRLVGTRVSVEPPVYQGITVVARIRARAGVSTARLQEQALTALFRYFHPIEGGPEGRGWPFGRPVLLGEVSAVLQRIPGVEFVDDARLFAADPISGERGQSVPRIDISANALVFSHDHQVVVEVAPA